MNTLDPNGKDECLTYFRRAIEEPASVPPWREWWAANEPLARRVFTMAQVSQLRGTGLRAAAVILRRYGWKPPPTPPAEVVKRWETAFQWLAFLVVVNWWACMGFHFMLRGTAAGGYAAAGQYSVRQHYRYTEVSAEQWYFSLIYLPASAAFLAAAFGLYFWNYWFRAKPTAGPTGGASPDLT